MSEWILGTLLLYLTYHNTHCISTTLPIPPISHDWGSYYYDEECWIHHHAAFGSYSLCSVEVWESKVYCPQNHC